MNMTLYEKNWAKELIKPPSGNETKCDGQSWAFKLKENPDGTLERCTPNTVRGFDQADGITKKLVYWETFRPMVKSTSIRLIFAMAATYNMKLE